MIYIHRLTVRTVVHSFGQPEETSSTVTGTCTEAEFSDEIQTKVLGVFLFVIHSHLYTVP